MQVDHVCLLPITSQLTRARFPLLLLPHHTSSPVNADTRWSAIGFAVMTLLLLPWTLAYYIGKNLAVTLTFCCLSMLPHELHEHAAVAQPLHAVLAIAVCALFPAFPLSGVCSAGAVRERAFCPAPCLEPADRPMGTHRCHTSPHPGGPELLGETWYKLDAAQIPLASYGL